MDEFRVKLTGLLPALKAYARYLTGSADDCADLVQDTCIRALEKQHLFDDSGDYELKSWLFRMMKNLWIDKLRKNSHQQKSDSVDVEVLNVPYDLSPEKVLEARSLLGRVEVELNSLPSIDQEIIDNIVIKGFSYAQTSDTLSLPIGTVMNRLYRARQKLKSRLDTHGDPFLMIFPLFWMEFLDDEIWERNFGSEDDSSRSQKTKYRYEENIEAILRGRKYSPLLRNGKSGFVDKGGVLAALVLLEDLLILDDLRLSASEAVSLVTPSEESEIVPGSENGDLLLPDEIAEDGSVSDAVPETESGRHRMVDEVSKSDLEQLQAIAGESHLLRLLVDSYREQVLPDARRSQGQDPQTHNPENSEDGRIPAPLYTVLEGGNDNDLLVGDEGVNVLVGGEGHDLLDARGGDDLLIGGEGHDFLIGGEGDDVLIGGIGNDALLGGDGDDGLDGNEGDDTLYGGIGKDWLIGGDGNDRLYGEEGEDKLEGGAGTDTLDGGVGNDTLYGGEGSDGLFGGDGNDRLEGGAGGDLLFGGAGDDILNGGAGDDILDAREGNNILTGGSGRDSFMFGVGSCGHENVIRDFELGKGGDVIFYSDLVNDPALAKELMDGLKVLDFLVEIAFDVSVQDGDTILTMTNYKGAGDLDVKLEDFDYSQFFGSGVSFVQDLLENEQIMIF